MTARLVGVPVNQRLRMGCVQPLASGGAINIDQLERLLLARFALLAQPARNVLALGQGLG